MKELKSGDLDRIYKGLWYPDDIYEFQSAERAGIVNADINGAFDRLPFKPTIYKTINALHKALKKVGMNATASPLRSRLIRPTKYNDYYCCYDSGIYDKASNWLYKEYLENLGNLEDHFNSMVWKAAEQLPKDAKVSARELGRMLHKINPMISDSTISQKLTKGKHFDELIYVKLKVFLMDGHENMNNGQVKRNRVNRMILEAAEQLSKDTKVSAAELGRMLHKINPGVSAATVKAKITRGETFDEFIYEKLKIFLKSEGLNNAAEKVKALAAVRESESIKSKISSKVRSGRG